MPLALKPWFKPPHCLVKKLPSAAFGLHFQVPLGLCLLDWFLCYIQRQNELSLHSTGNADKQWLISESTPASSLVFICQQLRINLRFLSQPAGEHLDVLKLSWVTERNPECHVLPQLRGCVRGSQKYHLLWIFADLWSHFITQVSNNMQMCVLMAPVP